MFKIRIVKRNKNITIFNPGTGEVVIDGDGNCDSPLLLDVSLTKKCSFCCKYCYMNTSPLGKHMSLDDFKLLIKRMKEAKVFQVAYGGGNPNEHPNFAEILKITYESGIIPNYSTNGLGLTQEIIDASNKFCGAVAISIHKPINQYNIILEKLTKKLKKLNLHFVMTKSNVKEISEFLCNPPAWSRNINAVVLLRYKSVPNSNEEEPSENEYKRIFANAKKSHFKIAFDACSYPLIKKFLPGVNDYLYDFCQGARSSAYVNENLIMSPCSFDCKVDFKNDLHNYSIKHIFTKSKAFRTRRKEINNCKICKQFFKSDCISWK